MDKIRGVNLGGWLVLERWISPSLFRGSLAPDETSFWVELSGRKQAVLNSHYESWITEADFAWIAQHGLNTVRIPVGYWLFGDELPFTQSVNYLDKAFAWAEKHGLQIIIDLHAAPGSQNGNDHSGKKGSIDWHTNPSNITKTLDVIAKLAKRFGNHSQLLAIELLNEPNEKIPRDILVHFYQEGYARVRAHSGAAVIMADAWQPDCWQGVLSGPDFQNVWLDVHLYQAFGKDNERLSMLDHLKKVRQWSDLLEHITSHPTLVGEWSLGLPPKAFRGLGDFDRDKAMQAYGKAQLQAFAQSHGWCYWTYKTEDKGAWSLRDCVARGWLPSNFEQGLVE